MLAAPLAKPPTFSGLEAAQDAAELAEFIALVQSEGVRAYGEVGTKYGDTFHSIMSALPPRSKGVALDNHARGCPDYHQVERVLADLGAKGYVVSHLLGDSHRLATYNIFRKRGPYDCIFIDGDHSLSGVTSDWNIYRDMTRIVAFHDIAGPRPRKGRSPNRCQVKLLWKEIKQSHRTVEFVNPGSWQGIGVAWCR